MSYPEAEAGWRIYHDDRWKIYRTNRGAIDGLMLRWRYSIIKPNGRNAGTTWTLRGARRKARRLMTRPPRRQDLIHWHQDLFVEYVDPHPEKD